MNTSSPGNLLIAELDSDDRHAALAHSTPVEFTQGQVLLEPGDPIEHVWFVESGIVSAVAVLQDGRTIETTMTGREGLIGAVASAVPHRSHTRFVAQFAGTARRMDAARLRSLRVERPGLSTVIGRFLARLHAELEQSCACNALHRAEQRFAKWLVRCHDRLDGDTLHLTQEHLASMLGSQRTTVNEAAQTLQRAGAVAYSRGRLTILDRALLERSACECLALGRAHETSFF